MNNDIKLKVEQYVKGELDYLNNLDSTLDEYNDIRTNSVKNINTFIELLQKEDINVSTIKCNEDKILNEVTKLSQEYELNIKKQEDEVIKNNNNLNLEKEKMKNDYETNHRKIQVEIDKDNNNLRIENRKIDVTEIKNNEDTVLKSKELEININKDKELRNDRIIKVVTDTAVILVPIIFYNIWMNKGFRFEETGTYTSNTFKNLLGKFKPTK